MCIKLCPVRSVAHSRIRRTAPRTSLGDLTWRKLCRWSLLRLIDTCQQTVPKLAVECFDDCSGFGSTTLPAATAIC